MYVWKKLPILQSSDFGWGEGEWESAAAGPPPLLRELGREAFRRFFADFSDAVIGSTDFWSDFTASSDLTGWGEVDTVAVVAWKIWSSAAGVAIGSVQVSLKFDLNFTQLYQPI